MIRKLFITGTDTDSGKTFISSLILRALSGEQILTSAFKPLASGSYSDLAAQNALRNPDALILQRYSGLKLSYDLVNPFCFEPAIAPHVAAQKKGLTLSNKNIGEAFARFSKASEQADILLTEGAGGWLLPVNESELLSDWVKSENFGVIIVVALKLGCINHALLTASAIQHAGLKVVGWVANRPQPQVMDEEAATLDYLKEAMPGHLLADIGFATETECSRFSPAETNKLLKAIGYSRD